MSDETATLLYLDFGFVHADFHGQDHVIIGATLQASKGSLMQEREW